MAEDKVLFVLSSSATPLTAIILAVNLCVPDVPEDARNNHGSGNDMSISCNEARLPVQVIILK